MKPNIVKTTNTYGKQIFFYKYLILTKYSALAIYVAL